MSNARAVFARALVGILVWSLAACGNGAPDVAPSPTGAPRTPGEGLELPQPGSPDLMAILREGAAVEDVLYPEMNGVEPPEIVAYTVDQEAGDISGQDYLDAYAWDPGDEQWVHVFEATSYSGPRGQPVLMTDDTINQDVRFLETIDFAGDGTQELALGVQVYGAAPGPLEVWIFSWLSEGFTVEFYEATERGGTISTQDATLVLETGKYRPQDPRCCPSMIETVVIGADPDTGDIVVLSRTEEESPQQ